MSHHVSFVRPVLAVAIILSLGACSNIGRSDENVLIATAAGATTGTVATVLTGGCVPCGAAIGAGVGAGAGFLYNRSTRTLGR